MTIWLTSDEHYGHANIIKYSKRPFDNVSHMNEELIRRHNAVVQDDDTVWHLGDFALDDCLVERYLPRLHGRRHHLVMGNHDACHPCHSRAATAMRRYERAGFLEIHLETRLDDFAVCHLPYAGDHAKAERFPEWRPKDEGRWLLHGHVHEHWRVRGRQINVGVDQWDFAPVALDTLIAIRAGALVDVPTTGRPTST